MSVTLRQVKNKRDSNGKLTGKAGTVYDVNVKYRTPYGYKAHVKRGFATRNQAELYEAEMKAKLSNPFKSPITVVHPRMTTHEFLDFWMERHGKDLRPATYLSYSNQIKNHILPHIGHVYLTDITPEMLDGLFRRLFDGGLSSGSVVIVRNLLSVAMETARKYHYIDQNPVHDTITKFMQNVQTPEPYTIRQVHDLLKSVLGTQYEMLISLASMYGLRLGECIGMRWPSVDFEKGTFSVIEQMPYNVPAGTALLQKMAPLKSDERVLPITPTAKPIFERQVAIQQEQRRQIEASGGAYYDNQLVIAHMDGRPLNQSNVSADFRRLLIRIDFPHIRFHDLRHSAATNMHQLTGDFYTVGKILGHSLKGIGMQLGISNNLHAVTERYVDVRLERIKVVIETYHRALNLDTSKVLSPKDIPKPHRKKQKQEER